MWYIDRNVKFRMQRWKILQNFQIRSTIDFRKQFSLSDIFNFYLCNQSIRNFQIIAE